MPAMKLTLTSFSSNSGWFQAEVILGLLASGMEDGHADVPQEQFCLPVFEMYKLFITFYPDEEWLLPKLI